MARRLGPRRDRPGGAGRGGGLDRGHGGRGDPLARGRRPGRNRPRRAGGRPRPHRSRPRFEQQREVACGQGVGAHRLRSPRRDPGRSSRLSKTSKTTSGPRPLSLSRRWSRRRSWRCPRTCAPSRIPTAACGITRPTLWAASAPRLATQGPPSCGPSRTTTRSSVAWPHARSGGSVPRPRAPPPRALAHALQDPDAGVRAEAEKALRQVAAR